MADQFARGLFAKFGAGEHPFQAPNGMEDNLRLIDDHLGLYTLEPPVAPETPQPEGAADGAGQIYTDGSYAVLNGGTWKTYSARRGVYIQAADGTSAWLNSGAGWNSTAALWQAADDALDAETFAKIQEFIDSRVRFATYAAARLSGIQARKHEVIDPGSSGSFFSDSSDIASGAWFTAEADGFRLVVSAKENGTITAGLSVNRGDTGASFAYIKPTAPRVNSKAYPADEFLTPATPNTFFYRISTAGTTGASPPTFPTTVGATVADGTAVLTCMGVLGTGSTGVYPLSASATITSMAMSADDGGTLLVRASDGTRLKRDLSGPVNVLMFGTPIDGISDASAGIQRQATLCDSERARYVYIPSWKTDYLIDTPISIKNPGVRIFGDHGGTYNRTGGRKGWLLGKSGLTHILDLGAARAYVGNSTSADNWQVDGLSLKQAVGVTARTIDGIHFSSRTDGPDRGGVVRNMSFIGLKDAITVEAADLQTALANLDIEGCVFQANACAINAKGNVLGFRFVGNQCEQNLGSDGILRGSLNGPGTITDNMLEGQNNFLSVDIPPVTGNNPQIEVARNYLEANAGLFFIRFRNSTSGASLTVKQNFISSISPDDYVLFDANTGGVVKLDLQDVGQTFTFKDSGQTIECADAMIRRKGLGFFFRKGTVNALQTVIARKFAPFIDMGATHTVGLPKLGSRVPTPWGTKLCVTGGSRINLPLAVVTGELISINMIVSVKEVVAGSLLFHALNPGLTLYVAEGSSGVNQLDGEWALVNKTFVAKNDAASLEIRLFTGTGTYEVYIAGVAGKNFGAFANDGTTKQLIPLVAPNVIDITISELVDLAPIASGAYFTYTMTTPAPGAIVGDLVHAQLENDMADVQINAWVSAANTIKVMFTNNNPSARDFTSKALVARVIR